MGVQSAAISCCCPIMHERQLAVMEGRCGQLKAELVCERGSPQQKGKLAGVQQVLLAASFAAVMVVA
jgi:hypothetical protein